MIYLMKHEDLALPQIPVHESQPFPWTHFHLITFYFIFHHLYERHALKKKFFIWMLLSESVTFIQLSSELKVTTEHLLTGYHVYFSLENSLIQAKPDKEPYQF